MLVGDFDYIRTTFQIAALVQTNTESVSLAHVARLEGIVGTEHEHDRSRTTSP